MRTRIFQAASGAALLLSVPFATIDASQPPALADLFADPAHEEVKISPDGQYIGVIVPIEGHHQLVTLTSDKTKVLSRFSFRESNESVRSFSWLKDNHLLIEPATVVGWADQPQWYGDLFAASIDGKSFKAIYGYRAGEQQLGSNIKKAEAIRGWGSLLSDLPNDPDNILIASVPYSSNGASTPSVLKVRLRDGRSWKEAGAPRYNAEFIVSPSGTIRFATAVDSNDIEHVYEFSAEPREWSEIAKNSAKSGAMTPVGVSADGKTAYYLSDTDAKTNGLYALNSETKASTLLYRHEADNIVDVTLDPYTGELIWIRHGSDNSVQILNPEHRMAKVQQMLAKAFPDSNLYFTSITRDYKNAFFFVSSDRDPGVWYSIDTATRKAHLELEANPKIDPEQMVPMTGIALKARDGLELNGFYTAKKRSDDKKPPMVLLVHGGPHEQDEWAFNPEVQALATRGYAVLQVNFRGSTGYGRDFEVAGRGQWGRAMQDDLTDATQWAIAQGLADPERICIMGGSYGGYASLMGLIREPKLYQCGIDMFGVTDLDELFSGGEIPDMLSGRAYLKDAIGTDRKEWDARSPTQLAAQIQVPVLIIAGGQDKRVPMAHSEKMEKALKRAGKSVETLYYDSEGHGFFKLEHRVEAYQKVLDFLEKNIGKGDAG